MVILRPTKITDLDYVLAAEHNQENSPYVFLWSREQHLEALTNPDLAHLIVEVDQVDQKEKIDQSNQIDSRVGYMIMVGLEKSKDNIVLGRIVITQKGKGYGRGAIELIKARAFKEYKTHRLWLDVKDFNHRAQALYRSAGFILEGTLRECLKTENGYESLQVMSILSHEYQAELGG